MATNVVEKMEEVPVLRIENAGGLLPHRWQHPRSSKETSTKHHPCIINDADVGKLSQLDGIPEVLQRLQSSSVDLITKTLITGKINKICKTKNLRY